MRCCICHEEIGEPGNLHTCYGSKRLSPAVLDSSELLPGPRSGRGDSEPTDSRLSGCRCRDKLEEALRNALGVLAGAEMIERNWAEWFREEGNLSLARKARQAANKHRQTAEVLMSLLPEAKSAASEGEGGFATEPEGASGPGNS